jgi:dephospho-CoA kinase
MNPVLQTAMSDRFVPVISLLGGVGSGKSHIARLWAESFRATNPSQEIVVIDADAVGHQVLREVAIKSQVRSRFGDGVFDSAGEVDRSRLGRLVFGRDASVRQARRDLEAIVHPRIGAELTAQIAQARTRPDVAAVVLDAAILLEAGWQNICHVLVFLDTPVEHRLQRVASTRGWTEAQLKSREESQLGLEIKRAACHHVINNSGSETNTVAELHRFLHQFLQNNLP